MHTQQQQRAAHLGWGHAGDGKHCQVFLLVPANHLHGHGHKMVKSLTVAVLAALRAPTAVQSPRDTRNSQGWEFRSLKPKLRKWNFARPTRTVAGARVPSDSVTATSDAPATTCRHPRVGGTFPIVLPLGLLGFLGLGFYD